MKMNQNRVHIRCVASVSFVVLACSLLAGCSESGPALLPVKGKVTIDGKPATEGGVTFRSTQNEMVQLVGAIGPDGTYIMMHKRDEGALAGEYKVTVLVTETPKAPDGNYNGLPKTMSNRKFADPKTTPLKVEVKDGAPEGSYDLAVTK